MISLEQYACCILLWKPAAIIEGIFELFPERANGRFILKIYKVILKESLKELLEDVTRENSWKNDQKKRNPCESSVGKFEEIPEVNIAKVLLLLT